METPMNTPKDAAQRWAKATIDRFGRLALSQWERFPFSARNQNEKTGAEKIARTGERALCLWLGAIALQKAEGDLSREREDRKHFANPATQKEDEIFERELREWTRGATLSRLVERSLMCSDVLAMEVASHWLAPEWRARGDNERETSPTLAQAWGLGAPRGKKGRSPDLPSWAHEGLDELERAQEWSPGLSRADDRMGLEEACRLYAPKVHSLLREERARQEAQALGDVVKEVAVKAVAAEGASDSTEAITSAEGAPAAKQRPARSRRL